MKKNISFITMVIIFLFLGIILGYLYNSVISKDNIYALKIEKRNLENSIYELKEQEKILKQDIQNLDKKLLEKIDTDYMNPIDNAEQKCIFNSEISYETRKCIYEAVEKREKNIADHIIKLSETVDKQEYRLIKNSQDIWNKQKDKDLILIREFISAHPGTIHFDFAATDVEILIQDRQLFLEKIYNITNDKI